MRPLPFLAALALVLGGPAAVGARDLGPQSPGRFDYYVLALTWVPGFCATNGSDPDECARPLGFALHGLWPQDEGGDYPSDCSRAGLSGSDRVRFRNIYASPSMIGHEWAKHGTCSGLSSSDYFNLSQRVFAKVNVPGPYQQPAPIAAYTARALVHAFVAANPWMSGDGIRTVSFRGVITEVDVCVTKSGDFRAC